MAETWRNILESTVIDIRKHAPNNEKDDIKLSITDREVRFDLGKTVIRESFTDGEDGIDTACKRIITSAFLIILRYG